MANAERVKVAIAIMERAKARRSLYMPSWQLVSSAGSTVVSTEDEFHRCGNSACFGGHIAISPEFQADGGRPDRDGEPVFGIYFGPDAVAVWLDIGLDDSRSLVYGDWVMRAGPAGTVRYSRFYEKLWEEVNPDDVIKKLNELLENNDGQ